MLKLTKHECRSLRAIRSSGRWPATYLDRRQDHPDHRLVSIGLLKIVSIENDGRFVMLTESGQQELAQS